MAYLFSLAWKNLSRYRRRTLITASVLAVGLAAYVTIDSILVGLEQESEVNLLLYETGSARIMDPEYWRSRTLRPLDLTLPADGSVEDWLEARGVPHAPRVNFGADLIVFEDPYPQYGNLPVLVNAIDPDKDDDVFAFKNSLSAGRYPLPDEEGALIGGWLAEDLGAEIGYPITLVTTTRDGAYQTIDVEITGILNCPNPVINRSGVMIPLNVADEYLEMGGAVTEITLDLPNGRDGLALLEEIRQEMEPRGLDVLDWTVLGADYFALAEAKQGGSGMILMLVFIIAGVGISNTMLMAVFERIRELGMMRALGMKDRAIRRMFLIESGGIGLIGAVVGVIIGAIGNIFLVRNGIDYSEWFRSGDMGYRIQGIAYGVWRPETFVSAVVVGVLIAVGVAWISTRKALKWDIPTCLRHQ